MNIQLFRVIRPSNVRSAHHTKCKTLMLLMATTVLATLPISVGLSAQQKFTTIDVPGAAATFALSTNPRGDIVGDYEDSSFGSHGFLLSKGNFTAIDFPGALDTLSFSINPQGAIVGLYHDSSGNGHGFLLNNGTFTTIDVPGATFTAAETIGVQGDIVGFYNDSSGNTHGFLLSK